ncbi:MAG: hypothetical protein QM426_07545 [Euryarchaeota archaeon]|nr:hypothetical protein [Euryarchaeota archaeon]
MDVNINSKGGKSLPFLLLFVSLILIGISIAGFIVESFNYIPFILIGLGIFLLALSLLKKDMENALKIASSGAFIIGILLGVFLWGGIYINIFLIFVVFIIVYIG